MKYLCALIIMAFLGICATGQTVCDLNGDGIDGSVADLVYLMEIYLGSPDSASACGLNCNIDGDNDSLTIADLSLFAFHLSNPDTDPPIYTDRPSEDTLMMESVQAAPGEQLYLSLYLFTVDTLIVYEIMANVDSRYLTVEGFIPDDDNAGFQFAFSNEKLHAFYVNNQYFNDSLLILPGQHHLGEMVIAVNPEIDEPVITEVTFGSCPDDNFYTGLANMTFFVPVLVDGEITITPVGISDEPNSLPLSSPINAYPNPFNSGITITAESSQPSALIICDILGREVNRFAIGIGLNTINWNSTDSDNKPVNSGIYFAKLLGSSIITKKLLLVK